VALRAAVGGRQGGTILARAETDWRGRFVLEEVPPTEEACLEVEADFYLTYRGPSLSIPAGADLELRIVTLHFGGSLSGEVLDGDGVRLPQAEVVLSRRDSIGSGQTVVSRTDSRGTFRLSGLAPGEYAMEVRHDGAIAARFAGMWIEADVPTVQIQLHLDGSPLIFSEEPDAQMFRVYRAERIIAVASRRFESLEEIQAYVDAMVASWWWRSELPRVEAIEVRMAKEETDPARGGPDLLWDGARGAWKAEATGHMELPTWAWSELVVLHEAAHVLSPLDKHGPTFARTLHYLIWRMLGEAAAAELALAYAAEGVQWW
jgi:putative metallohydrolase (TIGR04338 family)